MASPSRLLVPRLAALALAGLLAFVALSVWPGSAEPAAARSGGEASALAEDVVLLHGLLRSERSMRPLAERLRDAGYRVHNLGYPSTEEPPEALVARLHEEVKRCCGWSPRVHFVTHSLGGILTRAYLAEHAPRNLGRVVMLAPPNRGSEYVDLAHEWGWPAELLGPTGAQLGTDARSLPNRLPDATFELGVVAGRGGWNPLGDQVLPGDNDGTVSVASTRLAGMRDHAVVDASHTFIMREDAVTRLVLSFLRQGHFTGE